MKRDTFWQGLKEDFGNTITIKQFCGELAKQMNYERELDLSEEIEDD